MAKSYSEKLKDPRWQKKRLRIFERDKWKCLDCGATDNTLHVHHLRYFNGADPWDYDDVHLATLCEKCHQNQHGLCSKVAVTVQLENRDLIIPYQEPDVITSINHQINQLTKKLSENIDIGMETEILKNLMYLYEVKKELKNS